MNEEIIAKKRKKGGQPGNQNAKKTDTLKMWSGRFPQGVKDKIKSQAARRGISQAEYLTLLVEADWGKQRNFKVKQ